MQAINLFSKINYRNKIRNKMNHYANFIMIFIQFLKLINLYYKKETLQQSELWLCKN